MTDVTNRHGQRMELTKIESVEDWEESYSLKLLDSWCMGIGKSECGDFIPQAGDYILVSYHGFNTIAGVIIEGHVIRAKSPQQITDEHEQWKKNLRLKRLENYVANHDKMQARVAALPSPLRRRMERFGKENGVDFWIEDADYEMACVEGAAALLRKVKRLVLIDYVDSPEANTNEQVENAVKWIDDWWALNTKEHNYDYKKQMEMVPDFGEGHSGHTAGAAKFMAVAVLEGTEV